MRTPQNFFPIPLIKLSTTTTKKLSLSLLSQQQYKNNNNIKFLRVFLLLLQVSQYLKIGVCAGFGKLQKNKNKWEKETFVLFILFIFFSYF